MYSLTPRPLIAALTARRVGVAVRFVEEALHSEWLADCSRGWHSVDLMKPERAARLEGVVVTAAINVQVATATNYELFDISSKLG